MAILAKIACVIAGIIGVLLLIPAGRLAVFGAMGGKFELGETQFNDLAIATLVGVLLVAGSLLILRRIDK